MAQIAHILHIEAPIDRVFEKITTRSGLQAWWTNEVEGSDTPGGVLKFRFSGNALCDMQVEAQEPPHRLKWQCIDGHSEWIKSVVYFQLKESDGLTRVHFRHDGWRETTEFMAQCNFSWGRYLESLRQLCEKGKGSPYVSDK